MVRAQLYSKQFQSVGKTDEETGETIHISHPQQPDLSNLNLSILFVLLFVAARPSCASTPRPRPRPPAEHQRGVNRIAFDSHLMLIL